MAEEVGESVGVGVKRAATALEGEGEEVAEGPAGKRVCMPPAEDSTAGESS